MMRHRVFAPGALFLAGSTAVGLDVGAIATDFAMPGRDWWR